MASELSNQEEGWVVCRVFKKKNYHKALESPQNSSAALSRSTIIQKLNNDSVLDQILMRDMFQSIPHADPILLKLVTHNWSDEDCVKILQRCREASTYNNEGRKEKVLIIDVVLNRDEDEADMTEVKLLFDVLMAVLFVGVCVCRELRKNGKGYSLSLTS
ncbi:isoflavone-7-O-methyltransferase 9-like [Capsicum chacoense]